MQGPHHAAKKLTQVRRFSSSGKRAFVFLVPAALTNVGADFGNVRELLSHKVRGAAGAECAAATDALGAAVAMDPVASTCSLRPADDWVFVSSQPTAAERATATITNDSRPMTRTHSD